MENEKKTEQRVVLNLSMDQAKQLNEFLYENALGKKEEPIRNAALKIANRIQKTITKHENSQHCKYCGNLSKGTYCSTNCAGLDERKHSEGHNLAEAMGVTGPEGN
jgi:hypothetical protein